MKKKYTILALVFPLVLSSCGVKKYHEPLDCEDLETVLADEISGDELSKAQKDAISTYHMIGGNWNTTFDCQNEDPASMNISIEEVIDSNVELFLQSEYSVCSNAGTVVFEAVISDSKDPDLDGKRFLLTGNVTTVSDDLCSSLNPYILDAFSETQNSMIPGFISFSLRIKVNCDNVISASKFATQNTETGQSGAVSVTQGDFCVMKEWQKIDSN
ncbi:MAG: hypothetical protein JXR91_04540 [Deltaproteobacteria bacterium]|nr:hypothetical protein [Deltaproteobacteria bacterium]